MGCPDSFSFYSLLRNYKITISVIPACFYRESIKSGCLTKTPDRNIQGAGYSGMTNDSGFPAQRLCGNDIMECALIYKIFQKRRPGRYITKTSKTSF